MHLRRLTARRRAHTLAAHDDPAAATPLCLGLTLSSITGAPFSAALLEAPSASSCSGFEPPGACKGDKLALLVLPPPLPDAQQAHGGGAARVPAAGSCSPQLCASPAPAPAPGEGGEAAGWNGTDLMRAAQETEPSPFQQVQQGGAGLSLGAAPCPATPQPAAPAAIAAAAHSGCHCEDDEALASRPLLGQAREAGAGGGGCGGCKSSSSPGGCQGGLWWRRWWAATACFFRSRENRRVLALSSAAGSVAGLMEGMTGMGGPPVM